MLTTPSHIIAATFAIVALAALPVLPSYASAAPTRDVSAPPASALPAFPSAAPTRDLASSTGPLTLAPDQRTPDARTPSGGIVSTTLASDQRTPDAREAGAPARSVVVAVDAPVTAGFDWTAAVIGAGGTLAIAMLAGAGIALMRRRSPHPVV